MSYRCQICESAELGSPTICTLKGKPAVLVCDACLDDLQAGIVLNDLVLEFKQEQEGKRKPRLRKGSFTLVVTTKSSGRVKRQMFPSLLEAQTQQHRWESLGRVTEIQRA